MDIYGSNHHIYHSPRSFHALKCRLRDAEQQVKHLREQLVETEAAKARAELEATKWKEQYDHSDRLVNILVRDCVDVASKLEEEEGKTRGLEATLHSVQADAKTNDQASREQAIADQQTIAQLRQKNDQLKQGLDAAVDRRGQNKAWCGNKLLNLMIEATTKANEASKQHEQQRLRDIEQDHRESRLNEQERVVKQLIADLEELDSVNWSFVYSQSMSVIQERNESNAGAESAEARLKEHMVAHREKDAFLEDMFELLKSVKFREDGSIKHWLWKYGGRLEHVKASPKAVEEA